MGKSTETPYQILLSKTLAPTGPVIVKSIITWALIVGKVTSGNPQKYAETPYQIPQAKTPRQRRWVGSLNNCLHILGLYYKRKGRAKARP